MRREGHIISIGLYLCPKKLAYVITLQPLLIHSTSSDFILVLGFLVWVIVPFVLLSWPSNGALETIS